MTFMNSIYVSGHFGEQSKEGNLRRDTKTWKTVAGKNISAPQNVKYSINFHCHTYLSMSFK